MHMSDIETDKNIPYAIVSTIDMNILQQRANTGVKSNTYLIQKLEHLSCTNLYG